MLGGQLAAKYAQALCELAQEKNLLGEVEQELGIVGRVAEQYQDLATLLYHYQVPAEVKKDTIMKLFKADLHDFVLNFLLLLVDKRRINALPGIIGAYRQLANAARNMIEAEIRTAMPLNPQQETALVVKLGKMTGKTVILKTSVDKSLISGVVVKIGDSLIDGSIARRLKSLETVLSNMQLTKIGVTS